MNLNQVEVKDFYDYQISDEIENMDKNPRRFISNQFYAENLYEDTKIEQLVQSIREKTLNRIILEALIYVESNDHCKLADIVQNLKEIRFSKNITVEEAQKLLTIFDKYIKKNFSDFNFLGDVVSLMIDLISMNNIHIKLDWRVYYMMFVQFYGIPKKEFACNYSNNFLKTISLTDFIKKATKFFHFTREDYHYLKEEISQKMTTIDEQATFALLLAQFFLPKKYFKHDDELQNKFMAYLENQSTDSKIVLLNFCKIFEYGIKVDKSRFIESFFSLVFCFLSEGKSLYYFGWPKSVAKDSSFLVSMCKIMAMLLIKQDFEALRDIIIKKFNVVLNLLSNDLTENDCSSFSFDFIELFLRNLKYLTCKEKYFEISEYDSYEEYIVLDEFRGIIDLIIKMMKPIITKSFLYNRSSTFSLFFEYAALTDISLIHIEFKDIILHLWENSFNDYSFSIKKIKIFLRSFLLNLDNKETFKFLITLIETSVDKISCSNEASNINIIEFFSMLFTLLLGFKEKNNLESSGMSLILTSDVNTKLAHSNEKIILKKINEISIVIVKKIIRLLSFFSKIIKEIKLEIYLYHMDKIITIETRREICQIILNHLKHNIIKEDSEFQMIYYFIFYFKDDFDDQCRLGKHVWQYCYKELIESEYFSNANEQNYSPLLKLRHNTKDQFTYMKNIVCQCLHFSDINEENFINLIKLLLNDDEQDKKKFAYRILKCLFTDLLLPIVRNNKIIYPSSGNLQFIKKVYDLIISPYELLLHQKFETSKKIINANLDEREKLLKICKKDFDELDETMTIYLRITYGFMNEFANIFMRDLNSFESELKQIASSIPEIELYRQLKSIKEKIIMNVQSFYQMSKSLKILEKSEKYFRRSFSAKLLDFNTSYNIRLISYYRTYLIKYRDLKFTEIDYIYKNISLSTMYSHLKLFKLQEKSDLHLVEKIFKFYLKFDDNNLIKNGGYFFAYMNKNLPADSTEGHKFFEKIIFILQNKLKKIPIEKEINLNDVSKLVRITTILCRLIMHYLNKISDITILLRALYKFRMLVDKFKFETSDLLGILQLLTNLANYKLIKPKTFFKIKTAQAFSEFVSNLSLEYDNVILDKMIFANSEGILKIECLCHTENLKNRLNIRQYLKDNLENQFQSENIQDSFEMIIDFLNTMNLSLDVFDQEDRKILEMAEKIYWRFFLDEKEMLKKNVYYAAIGTILNSKYKYIKCMQLKEVKVDNSSCVTSEISTKQKKNFEPMKKKYSKEGRENLNFESNECFDKELNSHENLEKLFLNFYNYQAQYLNLIETDSESTGAGINDIIIGRLKYFFNPHLHAAILVTDKAQEVRSLSETPSLFSYKEANILSFIFYFGHVTKYEDIFATYEKILDCKQHDQIVLTNCLVMFLFAFIKKIKLTSNFSQINQIIIKVMTYYTNGCNKRIDSEILGLITSVIIICNPEEIRIVFNHFETISKLEKNILVENTENSLLFFNYDESFLFESIYSLFSKFRNRVSLIFNPYTISILEKNVDNFVLDKIKWKKYSFDFEIFYVDFLFIKKIITFDSKDNYIYSYSEDIEEEINKILDLYNKDQSKESLNLLKVIYDYSIGYLIKNPSLMVNITSKFVGYIWLDPQNFEEKFDEIAETIFDEFSSRNIDVLAYISLFKNLLESSLTSDSQKFYIKLLRKLIVPRLNLIFNNEVEYFKMFSQIVNVLKTNECKEYFCHLILFYVINLFDDEISHSIIQRLIDNIDEEKTNSICLRKNKQIEGIVTILTSFMMNYELHMKPSTELIILKFQELNNKILKNNGEATKIIRRFMAKFYNRYSYTFEFVKNNVSLECCIAIKELSKSHSYFT